MSTTSPTRPSGCGMTTIMLSDDERNTAMSDTKRTTPTPGVTATLLKRYGCGTILFTGTDNALYERHLLFDNVVDTQNAGPRERFEAIARSVRDILSQRWLLTENTYERVNPKRI